MLAFLVEFFGGGAQLRSLLNFLVSPTHEARVKRAPIQQPEYLIKREEEFEFTCPYNPENLLIIPQCSTDSCLLNTEGWRILHGEPSIETYGVMLMGPDATSVMSHTIQIPFKTNNEDEDACYTLSFIAKTNGANKDIKGSYGMTGMNPVPFTVTRGIDLYVTQDYSGLSGLQSISLIETRSWRINGIQCRRIKCWHSFLLGFEL
jgi:hypothetical protein